MKPLKGWKSILALFATLLSAQAAAPVISPEVHPDRSVTFRFRAPNAREVFVDLEGAPKQAMRRDASGVWTATTVPLEPDYYGYSFLADGVSLADPGNAGSMKTNLVNLSNLVHVPGPASLSWEMNDVPHGVLHRHFYRSAVAGDERDFYVYTPPGYDSTPAARYPVLYLLHGLTDDASGWTVAGRANVILDNLIAEGRAVPMLVVMPLGYGAPAILLPGNGGKLRDENYARFGDTLLGEVMPRVEAAYRVRAERSARAIAGLSMGGAESMFVGLQHLETFSWICAMSAGVVSNDYAATFPRLDASANDRLNLFLISCGRDDDHLKANQDFRAWLTQKGVRHLDIDTPGAHTWMVWRRNLTAFAPRLFQPPAPGVTASN